MKSSDPLPTHCPQTNTNAPQLKNRVEHKDNKYLIPEQTFYWTTLYMDNKFYLTSQQVFQRITNLDDQINKEIKKLNSISQKQCGPPQQKIQQNRQITKQKKMRKDSLESALSRQCKTQINELKSLKAKIDIEKQLALQQMNIQNKTVQCKKRRQLKQAATFVIRNPKQKERESQKSRARQKSQDQKQIKNKINSKKNFMVAPHQLTGSRKSYQMSMQMEKPLTQNQEQEPTRIKKIKIEQNSIKYKTIEPKSQKNRNDIVKETQSLLQNDNTIKMSINSQNRYNNPNLNINMNNYISQHHNNLGSKSRQKSFIITSRKQQSSNSTSKQHRQLTMGLPTGIITAARDLKKESDEYKADSKTEIQKLNMKLKQMQDKLVQVQKKQREIQQMQSNKNTNKHSNKQPEIKSLYSHESNNRNKETSHKQLQIQQQKSCIKKQVIANQKVENKCANINVRIDKQVYQRQLEKQQQMQMQQKQKKDQIKEQEIKVKQRTTVFNLREQKLKKLNITSSTIAYNYHQENEKQKQKKSQVNVKQEMAQQIMELKKVIKQLKIQKIKQQALIVELQKQREISSNKNSLTSQSKHSSFDQHEFTFNQINSYPNSNSNCNSRTNSLNDSKNDILSNGNRQEKLGEERRMQHQQIFTQKQKQIGMQVQMSESNEKPLMKKQPRRSLKSKFQSAVAKASNVSYMSNMSRTNIKNIQKIEVVSSNSKQKQITIMAQKKAITNTNTNKKGNKNSIRSTKDRKQQKGMMNNSDKIKGKRANQQSNPQQSNQRNKQRQRQTVTQIQQKQQLARPIQYTDNIATKKGKIIRQLFNYHPNSTHSNKDTEQIHYEASSQNENLLQDISVQKQNELKQFYKPEINIPQIQTIEVFPIPELPTPPTHQTQQAQIFVLAKKICELFQIKVQSNQQLHFKKFKNCIILKTKYQQNNKAIVWHFSGKFYVGGWEQKDSEGEDFKSGNGFQFVPQKHYYRGEFAEGKKNGFGTMITLNGNVYKGEWKNGDKHGKGLYYQKLNNSYYQGTWKEGKKDGQGIMKSNQKQFFIGKFQKSLKNGLGLQLFANGDIYEGEYKNGKFCGKGRYFWSNGSIYVGKFIDGQRQGFGKWRSSLIDGDIYEGEYKKDKKEGKGKYTWHKGCIFDGNFIGDMKHGQGLVLYPDGRQVSGVWEYGKLKNIIKNQLNSNFQQSQISYEQIQPRIRPNLPRVIETPSKRMQASRLLHGV